MLGITSVHGGKLLWLHMALKITGYAMDELPFDGVHHPQFKRCIQHLLCPWLSVPRPLSFKVISIIVEDPYMLTLIALYVF